MAICEVGTAGSVVRAPSGRKLPAALPPGTPRRGVPTNTFTTAEVFAFERELEKLHPDTGAIGKMVIAPSFRQNDRMVQN
jgi:hypothetical protein